MGLPFGMDEMLRHCPFQNCIAHFYTLCNFYACLLGNADSTGYLTRHMHTHTGEELCVCTLSIMVKQSG